MAIGFKAENALKIYGDGNGFIVIEEYSDDACEDLIGTVRIHHDKLQGIIHTGQINDLLAEAWTGFQNV